MKKNICLITMLWLFIVAIQAQSFAGREYMESAMSYYSFNNTELTTTEYDLAPGEKIKNTYKYNFEKVGKVSFINLTADGKTDKYLCLYSDDIFLLYRDSEKYHRISYKPTSSNRPELFYLIRDMKTSSNLTEGNIVYSSENLGSMDLDTPWVEGKMGYGIGETIQSTEATITNMYWFNGYVSYNKPYLYEQNGRVKTIKVTDVLNDVSMVIELEDTPTPQRISFGESKKRNVIIEIMDVYPGTKYEDTCVNFILLEA